MFFCALAMGRPGVAASRSGSVWVEATGSLLESPGSSGGSRESKVMGFLFGDFASFVLQASLFVPQSDSYAWDSYGDLSSKIE